MTGEERLKALRSIRGMWKGKVKEIMQRIAAGREDCRMPAAKNEARCLYAVACTIHV